MDTDANKYLPILICFLSLVQAAPSRPSSHHLHQTQRTLNKLHLSTTLPKLEDWMSSDMFFFPPHISKHICFLKYIYH